MPFTVVVDRAVGYAPVEADWDTSIKDNFNSGVWVQLANSTLVADAANIDLTSISGSWAHLMLMCYLRSAAVAAEDNVSLRFNNDSAANYDYQELQGRAATATAAEAFATNEARFATVPGSTSGSNLFAAASICIPHYANASNNKALVTENSTKYGTSTTNMRALTYASFWRSNAAITRITIISDVGANLVAGCRVGLYGLP